MRQLGCEFAVVESAVDELSTGDPATVVVENALRKARAVANDPGSAGATVIGADTEVVLAGRVLGKPSDLNTAREYISALSGSTHEVHGGIAVIANGRESTAHSVTSVKFRDLQSDEIERYLMTDEWQERAGGYAIQGKGAMLVERIDGDYLNVVGLAVPALVELAPELFT